MPEAAVELAAGGLLLRPYRAGDAPALLAAVRESIDAVGRWLPWCHAGYGTVDAEGWIAYCGQTWRSGEPFTFAAFDAPSGEFLGSAGLNRRDRMHNCMNLGYWTRARQQGRGIARRASRLVADFGFSHVHLTRIEIVTAPDNRASRRVAEAIGARLQATACNRLVSRGVAADAALYALLS
jgi:ribosomal-protein-serine acetyltransferase